MKQKLIYIILLLAVVVHTRAANGDYTRENPVRFGLAMDYSPLEAAQPDGTPVGYDVEFTRLLMERLGLPLEFKPEPWKNIPRGVMDGKLDLALMTFSPYRQDSVCYSRAVFKLYYQILYRNEAGGEHINMRNLAGKKVAYLSSKPVTDTLTMAGAVPYVVSSLPEAVLDLSEGQFDAVICYRYQAKALIKNYRLTNLTAEDITLTPREYCYASLDKELILRIDEELEKMEDEGLIKKVYNDAGIFFEFGETPAWVWVLLVLVIIAFLIIFILLQRRYQHKLKCEIERAQRSEQAKTVFLGNVSHVLRTPLNAINGFSYVLRSDEDGSLSPEERIQLATLVHENGERLLYFIDEVLMLSNIETSEMKFSRTEVGLKETFEAYADEARSQLQKGVELKIVGTDDCRVCIDERLAHIVTKHFLDNAARYTSKGRITLTYRMDARGLYVEVKDTGCGVPEALRKNIFSLLMDKSTSVQDAIPGLGLTICRVIVERCNGKIGYIAPPEGGSCFWSLVPVKKVK